jgi:uncharacterized protein YjbI with pentapeptide repeats
MNKQDDERSSILQHPSKDDREAWKAFWKQQGQPWRTEPEIEEERQVFLAECRTIVPDIKRGIYPFKDIKLSRADVEWLLATHENGLGPVRWSDVSQRDRWGLDLRGANLCQENLHNLPLARLRGGLTWDEWRVATDEQRDMAGVKLAGTFLFRVHLEGARLRNARLEGAYLSLAHLEEAYLDEAHLERSNLFQTHFEGANLREAHLEYAVLYRATFDNYTSLENVYLGKEEIFTALVADVYWGGVSLANMNLSQVKMLGDEFRARQKEPDEQYFFVEWQKISSSGRLLPRSRKSIDTRLDEYMSAVRANRQLAVTLQGQGLNEVAARFGYHAQILQRGVWRRQRRYLKYAGSWLLALLAGYGYRPIRSVIWYLVIIFGFAIAYNILGRLPLFPDTFVFSLTSFHGRGFFPGLGSETSLHNPLVILAAFEAVIGLMIEISFIATFTQRFFGR